MATPNSTSAMVSLPTNLLSLHFSKSPTSMAPTNETIFPLITSNSTSLLVSGNGKEKVSGKGTGKEVDTNKGNGPGKKEDDNNCEDKKHKGKGKGKGKHTQKCGSKVTRSQRLTKKKVFDERSNFLPNSSTN